MEQGQWIYSVSMHPRISVGYFLAETGVLPRALFFGRLFYLILAFLYNPQLIGKCLIVISISEVTISTI